MVPNPADNTSLLVQDYLADTKTYNRTHTVGYVSLEGYLAGRVAAKLLQMIEVRAFSVLKKISPY